MLTEKQQSYLSAMDIDVWVPKGMAQVSAPELKPVLDEKPALPERPEKACLYAKLSGAKGLSWLVAPLSKAHDGLAQKALLEKIAKSIASRVDIVDQQPKMNDARFELSGSMPTLAQLLDDADKKRVLWQHLKPFKGG